MWSSASTESALSFDESLWLSLALGALLLALLYRWRLQSLVRRRLDLEKLVAERTDALTLANERLEQASYTDPLTGLRNRRYLLSQLPQDLGFYQRKEPPGFGKDHILLFALVDIDHFKRINDRYGHGGGDRVLQQFSALLTEQVRVGDYVTRWGGEEFLIVSRPLLREHAAAYASRICKAVAAHAFDAGDATPLRISCSVGYSEYPLCEAPPELNWEDLIELADRALYHVKAAGRDGWATFSLSSSLPFPAIMQKLASDREALLAAGAVKLYSSFDLPGSSGDERPFPA